MQLRLQFESLKALRSVGWPQVAGVWLSGPGAVGKGEIKGWMQHTLGADVLVNATTRAPRPGERDGIDYWFMSRSEFFAAETAGAFLHTRHIPGRGYYGLLRSEFGRPRRGLPVIEESPIVFERVAPMLDDPKPFLLLYLLPPDPFVPTLVDRYLARSDNARCSSDKLLAGLNSTLSLRQAPELRSAVRQLLGGGYVLFLVNDDFISTTATLKRHLTSLGLRASA